MCLQVLLFLGYLKHWKELFKIHLLYEYTGLFFFNHLIQEGFDFFAWLINTEQREGYKGSDNEQRVEDVWLEGEESQTHVGEDEVLCQEVQQLKQLMGKRQTMNVL